MMRGPVADLEQQHHRDDRNQRAPRQAGLPVRDDDERGEERAERAQAIVPNRPVPYRFALPAANHVFLPGHRIMVQVQSSWFPLYDRNPQTFVPSIFRATAADYKKATQRIYRSPGQASFIELPVVTTP